MQTASIIFQEIYKDILFIFIKLPKNEMRPNGIFSLLVFSLKDGCNWDVYECIPNESIARNILLETKQEIDNYENED